MWVEKIKVCDKYMQMFAGAMKYRAGLIPPKHFGSYSSYF